MKTLLSNNDIKNLNDLGFKLNITSNSIKYFIYKVRYNYFIELDVHETESSILIKVSNRYEDKNFTIFNGTFQSIDSLKYVLSISNIEDCELKQKCITSIKY